MYNFEKCANEEQELLNEWKKFRKGLISDGVVSWEDYLKSDKKVLFVLKEANGGEDWDLRDFLYKGGRPATWDNIVRWLIGIRNINKNFKWEEIEKIEESDRIKYLRSIAAINVKKRSGGHTANNAKVYEEAIEDKEFLKKQIELYNADLTICCGTESAYFDTMYENVKLNWERTGKGIRYIKDKEKVIISFNHPEARVKPNFLYYLLIDTIREIWKI